MKMHSLSIYVTVGNDESHNIGSEWQFLNLLPWPSGGLQSLMAFSEVFGQILRLKIHPSSAFRTQNHALISQMFQILSLLHPITQFNFYISLEPFSPNPSYSPFVHNPLYMKIPKVLIMV